MTPKTRNAPALRSVRAATVFWAALCSAAVATPAAAHAAGPEALPLSGVVTRISDGDTIQVRPADGVVRRVRLLGVNTYERDDPSEDKRFWAEMATRYAVQSLLGRTVRLTYDADKVDRFGRLLAYVWVDERRTFNESIIRDGYGPAFLKYPFRRDCEELFRSAEAEARRLGKGIWASREPGVIALTEAAAHLGEYVAVRFRCGRVTPGRKYFFLWSDDRRFEALLSKDAARDSGIAPETCPGKAVSVTGVLEGDRGFSKIYVLFRRQVRAGA